MPLLKGGGICLSWSPAFLQAGVFFLALLLNHDQRGCFGYALHTDLPMLKPNLFWQNLYLLPATTVSYICF